jgi:hypothetical protein
MKKKKDKKKKEKKRTLEKIVAAIPHNAITYP